MKNLKSFPFERNRYFYGKLLSVEDFETEQKYFNDKRRTINRFLFGTGVVCGLHVLEVDDESISLERGIALDFAGREILVDEPLVKKIVDLEGYDSQLSSEEDKGFYYLCLEYQEKPVELMHNALGAAQSGEGEFNKYRETYRLFVTQTEPEGEVFSPMRLYEGRTEVYCGNGVRIVQALPRCLEMGNESVLRIEIEKDGQQEISFQYQLSLSFLTFQDEASLKVQFQEKGREKSQRYVLEYPLKAAYLHDVQAEASLVPGSFSLKAGTREYTMREPKSSRGTISREDAGRVLLEGYYKGAMEQMVDDASRQSLYLAKIYVVRTADLCLIQRIEPLPFHQCIQHTEISTALFYQLSEEVKKLKRQNARRLPQGNENETRAKQTETACGETVLDLEKAKPGDVVYSQRILHGLGLHPVSLVLGYEVEPEPGQVQESFFGDASVFPASKDGFAASLGAKLETEEGSFVIGMRVVKRGKAKKVRVRWTAWKQPVEKLEIQKKRLYIQPDIPNLHVGESITFTTVSEGFQDERILWGVKDAEGGTIDKNGRYTAPQAAGVYRVSAASASFPEIGASTFVVVREKEEEW